MRPSYISACLISALAWTTAILASAQTPPEKLPWTLREHYTFSNGPLRLDYAVDNAEWRIKVFQEDSEDARLSPDVIVRDVGFHIELGDGRLLTHDALGHGGPTEQERELLSHPYLGEGMGYTLNFAPKDGLRVWHRMSTFRQWKFILVTVGIENISEEPVVVTKINSAIFGPGAISGLTEKAAASARSVVFRGLYPVFAKNGPASKIRFYDPERQVSMAFGLLPTGLARSEVDIQPGGGAWQGRIESAFAPGKTLAPGASLTSDPVWINFGTGPAITDAQYAWLVSALCADASSKHAPRAWVTIPDTEGISALRGEVANALQAGITHALIPGNWEGRPGSFEGGAPRYPRNIADAARGLRDAGAVPGITVDPLLGQGGASAWTAQSSDGQTWVNPGAPGGRDFAVNRMKRLVEMGFGFLVIAESQIPDEVLRHFELTRAEADKLAFDAAIEAACDRNVSVLPTAGGQLTLNRDDWLEAASAACRYAEYDVATAPVRLRFGSETAPDHETLTALRFWRGPIEFIGAPPRALREDLAALFRRLPLVVRPQDAANRSPLVWLTRVHAPGLGYMGANIVSFSGATPWALTDVESFSGEAAPEVLWRPQGDMAVASTDGLIAAANRLTTHGLLAHANQPVLAGVGEDITLGLDRVKNMHWDPDRRVLSGQVSGPLAEPAVAFFFMPQHMQLRAARVGSRQARPSLQGSWISLPLDTSGGAFELEFSAG